MKKFILTKEVTDSDIEHLKRRLIKLLLLWKEGKVSSDYVGDTAEQLLFSKKWPIFDKEDPRALPIRVLHLLDTWEPNNLCKEDALHILHFLNSRKENIKEQENILYSYLNNVQRSRTSK